MDVDYVHSMGAFYIRLHTTATKGVPMSSQTDRFSWRDAPDLMDRLRDAQNHPRNCAIDIMTFAGMCDSRPELLAHVERYEQKAAPVAVSSGPSRPATPSLSAGLLRAAARARVRHGRAYGSGAILGSW
jgi:hypothetical protein